jgi:hypothetical protein
MEYDYTQHRDELFSKFDIEGGAATRAYEFAYQESLRLEPVHRTQFIESFFEELVEIINLAHAE